ncbi:hypothetical protein I4U23_005667 [Adineta vaga]|nr:hypothetical protein I4U23_005667 [Adineta vaga]
MLQSNPNLSSFERKRLLNLQLSILPSFVPLNSWRVHRINRKTDPSVLHYLIELARNTTKYTIDTEHDYYVKEAALIQIEFIRKHSVILLIETCHLPEPSTLTLWLIKSLLGVIFNSSHVILSWGNIIQELRRFMHYDLISWPVLHAISNIDVQHAFKIWYNKVFVHDCGLPPYEDDHTLCACKHRPIKEKKHQWSLQKAIAYAFNEFLDKSHTNSKWRRQLVGNNEKQKKLCAALIQYAVYDCLAIEDYGISYSEAIGATYQTDIPLTPPENQKGKEDDPSNQHISSETEPTEEIWYGARLELDDWNFFEKPMDFCNGVIPSTQAEQFSNLPSPIRPTLIVPTPRASTPILKDPNRRSQRRTVTFNIPESDPSLLLPDIASLSRSCSNYFKVPRYKSPDSSPFFRAVFSPSYPSTAGRTTAAIVPSSTMPGVDIVVYEQIKNKLSS